MDPYAGSPSSSLASSSNSIPSSAHGQGMEVNTRRKRIAMVSDFFFPNTGGVELHLYQLSTCLIKRNNKVIIITHSYGNRKGVRYLTNGLKVYYIPQNQFYNQSSLPTLIFGLYMPLLRKILIREQIEIVHGHQAFSTMALEGMMHARTMGFKTCFTDHSLFGFADASSIHTNKLLKFSLSDAGHVICVSHTSKENTVLRASLDPLDVSVIPNAIDATKFTPCPSKRDNSKSTPNHPLSIFIIGAKKTSFKKYCFLKKLLNFFGAAPFKVQSRLVYRKGVDLMIEVIPAICRMHPNVVFIVGGSGPMQIDLEEMIERHSLQDRVEMLGAVEHHKVRDVLASGHIFLNCSLTEAFCIAIVEAVSCGLLCVSTRVGGVPEVLPDDMIKLAEPTGDDLIEKVHQAITDVPTFDPWRAHDAVKSMYSWFDVAQRTEIVYDRLLREERVPFMERLRRFYACGLWAGKIFCIVVSLAYLFWQILEWWSPTEDIELAPNLNYNNWQQHLKKSSRLAHTPSTDSNLEVSPNNSTGTRHVREHSQNSTGSSSTTSGHSRKPSRSLGRSIAGSMEILWEELPDDMSRPTTPSPFLGQAMALERGSSPSLYGLASSSGSVGSPRSSPHSSSANLGITNLANSPSTAPRSSAPMITPTLSNASMESSKIGCTTIDEASSETSTSLSASNSDASTPSLPIPTTIITPSPSASMSTLPDHVIEPESEK